MLSQTVVDFSERERQSIRKVLDKFKSPKSNKDIFYNLCFCICVSQTKYKKNMVTVEKLKEVNFYENDLTLEELEVITKTSRFFRNKAKYLFYMKGKFNQVLEIIDSSLNNKLKRNKISDLIKGLGLKTTSHFLRNLGAEDLAIIDVHIMRFLHYSERSPKNKNQYWEIEYEFCELAKRSGLTVAELDGIIWRRYADVDWEEFVY